MSEKYFVDLVKLNNELSVSYSNKTWTWSMKMRALKGEFQTTKHEYATFSEWLKDKHKIEMVYNPGGSFVGVVGLNFDTEHDYLMFLLKSPENL